MNVKVYTKGRGGYDDTGIFDGKGVTIKKEV